MTPELLLGGLTVLVVLVQFVVVVYLPMRAAGLW